LTLKHAVLCGFSIGLSAIVSIHSEGKAVKLDGQTGRQTTWHNRALRSIAR